MTQLQENSIKSKIAEERTRDKFKYVLMKIYWREDVEDEM